MGSKNFRSGTSLQAAVRVHQSPERRGAGQKWKKRRTIRNKDEFTENQTIQSDKLKTREEKFCASVSSRLFRSA